MEMTVVAQVAVAGRVVVEVVASKVVPAGASVAGAVAATVAGVVMEAVGPPAVRAQSLASATVVSNPADHLP